MILAVWIMYGWICPCICRHEETHWRTLARMRRRWPRSGRIKDQTLGGAAISRCYHETRTLQPWASVLTVIGFVLGIWGMGDRE